MEKRKKLSSLKGYIITEIKHGSDPWLLEIWGRKTPLKKAIRLAIVSHNHFFDSDGYWFEDL